MKYFLSVLILLRTSLLATTQCTAPASEFHLEGDYLIGGLFEIHHISGGVYHKRPEAMDCRSHSFSLTDYRKFQLMRFAVEEINNSTDLLPNVSLGYEMFDHCSDSENFPSMLKLISVNNLIQPWDEPHTNLSKVVAVVGPITSTHALTLAPFFMVDLIPMISYGSSTSVFSQTETFPSFVRTVHPNADTIHVIVQMIQHFNWHWVAFLYSDNDFGIDGLELCMNMIKNTGICLAYTKALDDDADYSLIFEQIEAQRINVIVVFAPQMIAEALIESAIRLNVTNKVWIAGDTWSLNKKLSKMEGIRNIGTVLGVSQPIDTIPGFNDFIYSTKIQPLCESTEQSVFCNRDCNCSSLTAEQIIAGDPSFSFPVYCAVYVIAQALHKTLKCGAGGCNNNITVYPYMVLAELKKSNFTLLNESVQFDESGNPKFGFYSIVFWNESGDAEQIGLKRFHPSPYFFINSSKIQWFTNGEVPTSLCSQECPVGYKKKQDGIHKCCFKCEICPNGTYVNSTADPYTCTHCKETEWSEDGSTSCSLRVLDYVPYTDIDAILIIMGAWVLVGLTVVMSVLFAINYNTPVVRSAGGPMCFLILGCLNLSDISVFFHFGKPTTSFCALRYLPFLLFYTVCLACFVVRSFQIVCIFKIAAKIPKLQTWWKKYHGQWLIISAAFVTQGLILLISYSHTPPKPYNETTLYSDRIVLCCDINLKTSSWSILFLAFLCSLCFIFSYMGKDLPKNYNEAKAITFCLLLLILTWIFFAAECTLYRGKYIQSLSALAVLSSLYCFLFWYFLPKCYLIIFQPHKNTQQYFQGLIQNYTKTISQ
ncbi:taste receptor type 1 member 1-like [Mugil cephalus]|uniref:taste receptor type 1 member 1-like n=1 Tax=Mugil cephalus TaxID=48193 RepID=UPI001FB74094|nr:taste receptor type 1 member 1-like [Mugil cephalus]